MKEFWSGSLETPLTPEEIREKKKLEQWTNRTWRRFWARVLKARGYSNAAIAKELEISESTVRSILKGA